MKIKVSISLDEGLVARIDRVAGLLGAKRSGLVQKWVERAIGEAESMAAMFGDEAVVEFGPNGLPITFKGTASDDDVAQIVAEPPRSEVTVPEGGKLVSPKGRVFVAKKKKGR